MDFSSTAAFFAMLDETMSELATHNLAPDLHFIRVVASKVDENKSMQKELLALMRQVFGLTMIRTPMKDSAEIDNVTARLMTVYEMNGPMTSKPVRDRCLTYLNGGQRGDPRGHPRDLAEPRRTDAERGPRMTFETQNCTVAISGERALR